MRGLLETAAFLKPMGPAGSHHDRCAPFSPALTSKISSGGLFPDHILVQHGEPQACFQVPLFLFFLS